MKSTILIALLLASAPLFADQPVVRLSEPVAVTDEHETFGQPLVVDAEIHSLSEVMGDAEGLVDQRVLVETRVSKVCQKKGCFFIAKDGDTVVRVSFRDYGFFVPTDIGSKTVLLEGSLVKVERSPEKAAHLKEDVGNDLVDDAVRVPKA